MNQQTVAATPHPTLEEAGQEFSLWRNTRIKKRERIPSHLWDMAIRVCDSHSVNVVSRALHISHTELKKRVESQKSITTLQQQTRSKFIELNLTPPASPRGCVVEMEKPDGLKMRVAIQEESIPLALEIAKTFIGAKS